MLICPYCAEPLDDTSTPEHVFPRSIGGHALVLDVHEACNALANELIDTPLVQCSFVRQARAAVRLRPHRRGRPYEEHLVGETIRMVKVPQNGAADPRTPEEMIELLSSGEDYGGQGAKVEVVMKGDRLDGRFLPNPRRLADGTIEVFTTESDEEPGTDSDFEPFHVLALVEAKRACTHPPETWTRFTAKAGLGLLALLQHSNAVLDDGFPVTRILSEQDFLDMATSLRATAFGPLPSAGDRSEPGTLVGEGLPLPRHRLGLIELDGLATVVVHLFDQQQFRLGVPDIRVQHTVEFELNLKTS